MISFVVQVVLLAAFILQINYPNHSLVVRVDSLAISNKMRYSPALSADATHLSIQIVDPIPEKHIPTIVTSVVSPEVILATKEALVESMDPKLPEEHHEDEHSSQNSHKTLDSEDKLLLEKFYNDTRRKNPYVENNLISPQSLWEDKESDHKPPEPVVQEEEHNEHDHSYSDKQTDEGGDLNEYSDQDLVDKHKLIPSLKDIEKEVHNDWSVDEEFARLSEQMARTLALDDNMFKQVFGEDDVARLIMPHHHRQPKREASYSPVMRLLTSYNPLGDNSVAESIAGSSSSASHLAAIPSRYQLNRAGIVGATIYGDQKQHKLSSKSPLDAIKMHDEMLMEPPHDGKVRVRMYFHRATHDDAKLYGTGPWKYWGHGWGVEYGYDPRSANKSDYYQRGYTIERAFGRDFCKDKLKCRKPDPEFFANPLDGGKYSEDKGRHEKRFP